MAVKIYRGEEADLSPLVRGPVAILGYGNQGRAHALNLRDSGCEVVVGQRPGASFESARADGFQPSPVSAAAKAGRLVVLALPDETAAEVYAECVAGHIGSGQTLGFIHGFNIRFGLIEPPDGVDVVMVAPKGPGRLLRSLYVKGKGLPALLAVERNPSGNARLTALAWAVGIGSARAGVVETSFADETETDLFGEQTVLCGGVTALMKAAFDTLVEAGYDPFFAYIECAHELKQVVDLIYEGGLSGMRSRISGTARYGDVTRGPRMINDATRAEMRRVLDEVRSGEFAREWIAECRAGKARLGALHRKDAESAFEATGRAVRSLMPWLGVS